MSGPGNGRGPGGVIRWAPLLGVVVAAAHLGWEATHGGIQSHHLMARDDLPSASNLWGLAILPALGWLAAYFVGRRCLHAPAAPRRAITAFVAAIVLGLALSAAFTQGLGDVAAGVFLTALAASLLFPTYRAEYAFGFVVGMAYVFGPVIPTLAAAILATVSVLANFVARPLCVGAYRRLRPAA
ncbi:MAG: hypothetical protein M3Q40_05065 [Pseudomonadota bacterium]|nr:hypothetical protein [Pseudomonadota bacterium]